METVVVVEESDLRQTFRTRATSYGKTLCRKKFIHFLIPIFVHSGGNTVYENLDLVLTKAKLNRYHGFGSLGNSKIASFMQTRYLELIPMNE